MRGLPFSLVCAHLQTETQGRKDQVVLNLDNMVDSHWCERSTGGDLLLLNFKLLLLFPLNSLLFTKHLSPPEVRCTAVI